MSHIGYYEHVRRDALSILEPSGRLLEIGAGGGGTLAEAKRIGLAEEVIGVDRQRPLPHFAPEIDLWIEGDLEAEDTWNELSELEVNPVDSAMCLDVLEHLVDPWSTLERIRGLVRPGGQLVVSIPNVNHYSVVFPLVLRGRWDLQDAGVLDRTHLRFFVRGTIEEMIKSAGWNVEAVFPKLTGGRPGSLLRRVATKTGERFTTVQYLMGARN